MKTSHWIATRSLVTLLLLFVTQAIVAQQYIVQPVMTGLDSPRGLAFDPSGALYVAEAGRGGGPNAPSVIQRGSPFHYGPTGAVSRLRNGVQERVLSGLPSLAMANGTRAIGPSDVAFRAAGQAYITIMLEGDPAQRAELGAAGAGLRPAHPHEFQWHVGLGRQHRGL